jgi:hypothetical protein
VKKLRDSGFEGEFKRYVLAPADNDCVNPVQVIFHASVLHFCYKSVTNRYKLLHCVTGQAKRQRRIYFSPSFGFSSMPSCCIQPNIS